MRIQESTAAPTHLSAATWRLNSCSVSLHHRLGNKTLACSPLHDNPRLNAYNTAQDCTKVPMNALTSWHTSRPPRYRDISTTGPSSSASILHGVGENSAAGGLQASAAAESDRGRFTADIESFTFATDDGALREVTTVVTSSLLLTFNSKRVLACDQMTEGAVSATLANETGTRGVQVRFPDFSA